MRKEKSSSTPPAISIPLRSRRRATRAASPFCWIRQLFPIAGEILAGKVNDLWILLRGDFVLDSKGKAVDAEFARAELPTGDHPNEQRVRDSGRTVRKLVHGESAGLEPGIQQQESRKR